MTTLLTTQQIAHKGQTLANVLNEKIGIVVEGSAAWDPPAISSLQSASQVFFVAGAAPGDFVHLGLSTSLAGCILTGYCDTADQVTAVLFNPTGTSVNILGGVLKYRLTRLSVLHP